MNGPGGHSQRGSHRLSTAPICPRMHYFRWNLGLKPREEPIYFTEGTVAHIALAYYRANQMHLRGMKVPDWFYERTMLDCLHEAGRGKPDTIRLGLSILNAYAQYYEGNDPWEPIAIEEEFFATLGEIRRLINPYAPPQPDDAERFSARIDLLVRYNGFLWATDYKTTKGQHGKLGPFNYEGEHTLSFQFLVQTAILRARFGAEFRGVIVERIFKSEPHDFGRTPVPIHAQMFRDLPDTLAMCAQRERELEQLRTQAAASGADMNFWLPPGAFWACYAGGRACDYKALCVSETLAQRNETVVREYLKTVG